MLQRYIGLLLSVIFFLQSFLIDIPFAHSDSTLLSLPATNQMMALSAPLQPVMLQGLRYDPQAPFQFEFILQQGDHSLPLDQLRDQGMELVRYFMAAMTMPSEELWVNLSPYEKDRIIPSDLGVTRLGSDMLVQDYVLKQLASSLTFPDSKTGDTFWKKIYSETQARFGRTDVPVSTFNKVWIVPDYAEVLVKDNTVVITDSHLKVMMEQDYLAQKKASCGPSCLPVSNIEDKGQNLASDVMRRIIVPILEKEVNTGSHFAALRQMFHTVVLAEWYKRNLKNSLFNQYYANQHKVIGIDEVDKRAKEAIYKRYLSAYKKGVYNFIREDTVPQTGEIIPRKYFSGGLNLNVAGKTIERRDASQLSLQGRINLQQRNAYLLDVGELPASKSGFSIAQNDHAMTGPSAAPGSIEEFIRAPENENPYWTYTKKRLEKQREFLFDKDPDLIDDLINKEVLITEGWHTIATGPLNEKRGFEARVANNNILGPPKGGIRYLSVDELMETPFKQVWKNFLKLKPTVEQGEAFLAQWLRQECLALSTWGMTGKAAGLGLELGGGKGLVFKGSVVKGEDGLPEIEPWNVDKKKLSDEEKLAIDLNTASHHARQLTEAGAVGIDIDSPAPDKNTTPLILEKYNEIYLRVLTEKGAESFVWKGNRYDALYIRLKTILDHIDSYTIFQNPLLEEAVRFSEENPDLPMPWTGVFTGKRYSRLVDPNDPSKGIVKMGGVMGRNEATGEGLVMVMKHFLDLTVDGYDGKTVAIQAFGNVGRYTALAAAREGFNVVVINDYGISLVNEKGWSENQLNEIIDSMNKNKMSLRKLWATHRELFTGVNLEKSIIVDNVKNTEEMEKVFNTVIGAPVDILIPAFMEGQITKDNYHMIKAKWIFEGANGPVTAEADDLLINAEKIVVPDTLANAGGVLCSGLEMIQALQGREFTKNEVLDEMQRILERAVENTLSLRPDENLIRPGFDRVGLINLARARMKGIINTTHGELNEIRKILHLKNVFLVNERIKKLGLSSYWHAALRRNFNELEAMIRQKCDQENIPYSPEQLHLWLESLSRLNDESALEAKNPDQGPLVYVRVLRRVLVDQETIEATSKRLNYTSQRAWALRQNLSNKFEAGKDRYSIGPILDYLTANKLLPLPNSDMAMANVNGGIDFDASHMLIDQNGEANFQDQIMPSNSSQWEGIKGLQPIFLRLQPVNIPELMGIDAPA